MPFSGFSIPDGAYLPPEVIYLLPNITGAKLKILLAVLYTNLQFGAGEALSFADIQRLTGLTRSSVNDSLSELLSGGFLERTPVGNSFTYAPVVKFSYHPQASEVVQKLNHLDDELRESESQLNINLKNSLTDSLNLTTAENGKKILLTKKLRAAGIYLKTAQGIVEQHDEATIEQHMEYYHYAIDKNMAQGPGWLVMSLKEGWQAPLGYTTEQVESEPETGPEEDVDRPIVRVDVSVETPMANGRTALQAWTAVKQQLQLEMPKSTYNTIVKDTELVSYMSGTFQIDARTAYYAEWMRSRLTSTMARLLTGICNQPVQIEFVGGSNE